MKSTHILFFILFSICSFGQKLELSKTEYSPGEYIKVKGSGFPKNTPFSYSDILVTRNDQKVGNKNAYGLTRNNTTDINGDFESVFFFGDEFGAYTNEKFRKITLEYTIGNVENAISFTLLNKPFIEFYDETNLNSRYAGYKTTAVGPVGFYFYTNSLSNYDNEDFIVQINGSNILNSSKELKFKSCCRYDSFEFIGDIKNKFKTGINTLTLIHQKTTEKIESTFLVGTPGETGIFSSKKQYSQGEEIDISLLNFNPKGRIQISIEGPGFKTGTPQLLIDRNLGEILDQWGRLYLPNDYQDLKKDNKLKIGKYKVFVKELKYSTSYEYEFEIANLLQPTFTFTPTNPKSNQVISFKDESTGNPTSWAWEFGDGTTSTQQNPNKTYTKAGTYTVKLTVTKQGATEVSTTKSIIVVAEPMTLALSATTRNAPASGEQGGLNITTNTTWTAGSNAIWLKVSPVSGNAGTGLPVNYTVDANTATAARTGIITFKAGSQTATFTVAQAGVAPSLTVTPTSPTAIVAAGSTIILSLISNLSWTVIKSSGSDWLNISPASGTGNANVSVTAAINSTINERSATLTFSALGVPNVAVIVRQSGANVSLSLSATTHNAPTEGEQGGLNITTNTTWIASGNANWLKVSPVSGNAGANIPVNYTVEANIATTARTGIITFTAGNQTATFTVTQEAAVPTPPQAPSQLIVKSTSESELRLSWTDNANNETGFEIERMLPNGDSPEKQFTKIATVPANTTSYINNGLISLTEYCYRVRAGNSVGNSAYSNQSCATTNPPPAGITLLVHGFSIDGNADFKQDFAQVAQAIAKRAGAGATVYTNDPQKGTWKKWELVPENGNGDPNKEIILFYNWANASNNELLRLKNLQNNLLYMSNSGYLEGAADILFAMLADAQIPALPNNLLTVGKPLHFIGHSRGTILLLQLMHRMAKWLPNVKIDHYTALDPHPGTSMGDVVRTQKNTYSSLPLVSGIADNCTATIGCSSASSEDYEIKLRLPANVMKAEVYYRKDGDYEDANTVLERIIQTYLNIGYISATLLSLYINRYEKLVTAFDGVPSIGGVNNQLDNAKVSLGNTGGLGGAHSGVVSWYFGTIDTKATKYEGEQLFANDWYGANGALLASKPAREKSGYYFSRIGGGYAQLANATDKVSLDSMDKQLSIRPREGSIDGGMTLGIQNGNFEYNNDSGWRYGGGISTPSTGFKQGKAQGKEIGLTHSLLYFPSTTNYVQIHLLKNAYIAGIQTLSVQFLNRDFSAVGQAFEVTLIKNENKVLVKIPAILKGKSGSFTIKGTVILLEKVEFSDRSGSQELIIEPLAIPETPQEKSVELYELRPNPNNGWFSIVDETQLAPATSIVMSDMVGNVVFQATEAQLTHFNTQHKLEVVLHASFTGVYMMRIETAKGIYFKRIVRE